jgi:hypothetical protein
MSIEKCKTLINNNWTIHHEYPTYKGSVPGFSDNANTQYVLAHSGRANRYEISQTVLGPAICREGKFEVILIKTGLIFGIYVTSLAFFKEVKNVNYILLKQAQ